MHISILFHYIYSGSLCSLTVRGEAHPVIYTQKNLSGSVNSGCIIRSLFKSPESVCKTQEEAGISK